MRQVFVTGMLRSGTSLLQTLLTNHPQLFVAYQPFHQLYVDIRQLFLDEQGWERLLPLGDGMDAADDEPGKFAEWLETRVFEGDELKRLITRAATGKGGGAPDFAIDEGLGRASFLTLRERLHAGLAVRFSKGNASHVGAKEVLCEEYVPALASNGVRCFMIVRDPRAMIASANHGRYRELVGDRYPLLMLIRLWRKSARAWQAMGSHPMVTTFRYEDLVAAPDAALESVSAALSIPPFPPGLLRSPLVDHRGTPWAGNSSFGDKQGVDTASDTAWRGMLSAEETDFIESCAWAEMRALGYAPVGSPSRHVINNFVEDTADVRSTYLRHYALDAHNRATELKHWDTSRGLA